MSLQNPENLAHLSDQQLLLNTEQLVHRERELLTSVLHHLREVDRRRLFSKLGFKSLFDYAVKKLKYSEDQAYRRISAMRLLKEIPVLEEKLNQGHLSPSNLGLAQRFFRMEQKVRKLDVKEKTEVLKSLENLSTREAEKIVVNLSTVPFAYQTERIRPLQNDQNEVQFVADQALLDKLEKLKGLLAHQMPQATLLELFHKLCDLGLNTWSPATPQKQRGKAQHRMHNKLKEQNSHDQNNTHNNTHNNTNNSTHSKQSRILEPQSPSTQAGQEVQSKQNSPNNQHSSNKQRRPTFQTHKSRNLKISLKQQVWRQDHGQCRQCGSTYALQVDHIIPKSKGGSDELQNLRLLCRSCNQRAAIEHFGQQKIGAFLSGG